MPQETQDLFSEVLKDAYERYNKPVVLSETGHFGEDRGKWIRRITADCIKAIDKGVDLRGICLYPVLDRPDWDTGAYIPCGIWGYNSRGERTTQEWYLHCVQKCHAAMQQYLDQKISPKKKANVRYLEVAGA